MMQIYREMQTCVDDDARDGYNNVEETSASYVGRWMYDVDISRDVDVFTLYSQKQIYKARNRYIEETSASYVGRWMYDVDISRDVDVFTSYSQKQIYKARNRYIKP